MPGPSGSSRRVTEYLKALPDRFSVVVLSAKTPDHSHIEKYQGARLLRVPVGSGDLASRIQAFERAVRRQLESEDYALAHFTDPFGGYALCELKGDYGYRLVYEAQTFPSQELRYTHPQTEGDRRFLSKVRRQELFCLMNADLVITGSQTTRAYIQSLGASEESVRVVRAPVDLKPFEPDVLGAPDGDPFRLMYLGSHVGWQGLPTLLRAVALAGEQVDVRLTLVGAQHPDWQPHLDDLVKDLGLKDRVEFQAPVHHDDVAKVLALADAGVLPLDDVERNRLQGGPLAKVSEYFAAGRPVIAAELPVTRELIPEDTAVFFPPGDSRAMSERIIELARDIPRRVELGRRARAHAEAALDAGIIRGQLLDLYDSLLEKRVGPVPTTSEDDLPAPTMVTGTPTSRLATLAPPDSGRVRIPQPDKRDVPVEKAPAPAKDEPPTDDAPVVMGLALEDGLDTRLVKTEPDGRPVEMPVVMGLPLRERAAQAPAATSTKARSEAESAEEDGVQDVVVGTPIALGADPTPLTPMRAATAEGRDEAQPGDGEAHQRRSEEAQAASTSAEGPALGDEPPAPTPIEPRRGHPRDSMEDEGDVRASETPSSPTPVVKAPPPDEREGLADEGELASTSSEAPSSPTPVVKAPAPPPLEEPESPGAGASAAGSRAHDESAPYSARNAASHTREETHRNGRSAPAQMREESSAHEAKGTTAPTHEDPSPNTIRGSDSQEHEDAPPSTLGRGNGALTRDDALSSTHGRSNGALTRDDALSSTHGRGNGALTRDDALSSTHGRGDWAITREEPPTPGRGDWAITREEPPTPGRGDWAITREEPPTPGRGDWAITREEPPSPTPVVKAPAPLPLDEPPSPTPVVKAPAPLPLDEPPAPTPVVKAPAPLPLDEPRSEREEPPSPTPIVKAPAPLPLDEPPSPTPIVKAPAPLPLDEPPSPRPIVKSPASLMRDEPPAPTPIVKAPAPLPLDEPPSPTPIIKGPASLMRDEPPAPTPIVKAPAPLPLDEPPSPTPIIKVPASLMRDESATSPSSVKVPAPPSRDLTTAQTPGARTHGTPDHDEAPSPTPIVPTRSILSSRSTSSRVETPSRRMSPLTTPTKGASSVDPDRPSGRTHTVGTDSERPSARAGASGTDVERPSGRTSTVGTDSERASVRIPTYAPDPERHAGRDASTGADAERSGPRSALGSERSGSRSALDGDRLPPIVRQVTPPEHVRVASTRSTTSEVERPPPVLTPNSGHADSERAPPVLRPRHTPNETERPPTLPPRASTPPPVPRQRPPRLMSIDGPPKLEPVNDATPRSGLPVHKATGATPHEPEDEPEEISEDEAHAIDEAEEGAPTPPHSRPRLDEPDEISSDEVEDAELSVSGAARLIDDDELQEAEPDAAIDEAPGEDEGPAPEPLSSTLNPWFAHLAHGYCPPEGTRFARHTPPTTFPGRDEDTDPPRLPPSPGKQGAVRGKGS
ncbi:glycosyltransferase [Myxococcus dinghuensis]